MRRVLIVAYYFPPIGGIGSIRLARFASILPKLGWEPTVLAPRNTPHASDPQLHFPEDRVVRSRSIELSQIGRAVPRARHPGNEKAGAADHSLRSALRSAAHRYVFFPDAQIGWYPGAVAAGMRALRADRFDAIYSSSYPVTSHLVARTLSRRTGIPWVAEYRDPWSDRLYRDHPYRKRAQALERAVARDATTVIMPTRTWAAHYGAEWDTEVALLPNGFDAQLPERVEPERPTLTHVGSYYPGDHDLTTLWHALAQLRQRSPDEEPRIRFVGHLPESLRADITARGLGDQLESTGFVSHDEAMRELMSASMLIASGIPGDHPAKRGWVPAKLFEYLASGLPVLYIAAPDTDAAQIMSGHPGVYVVAPGDVDGVMAALDAGLRDGQHGRDVAHLSRESGARTLAAILDRAVGK